MDCDPSNCKREGYAYGPQGIGSLDGDNGISSIVNTDTTIVTSEVSEAIPVSGVSSTVTNENTERVVTSTTSAP